MQSFALGGEDVYGTADLRVHAGLYLSELFVGRVQHDQFRFALRSGEGAPVRCKAAAAKQGCACQKDNGSFHIDGINERPCDGGWTAGHLVTAGCVWIVCRLRFNGAGPGGCRRRRPLRDFPTVRL
ncbi:MAG: hypothetical protein ACLR8Y_08375 [Alistipes indistinctus]